MTTSRCLPILGLLLLGACTTPVPSNNTDHARVDTIGYLEVAHPDFHRLVPSDARIEILAEGFTWSEGPVWIPDGGYLLFSDVPENMIYRWDEQDGLSVWLSPSGETGYASGAHEGSNGLLLNKDGELVLCQHGDRRVAKMNADLEDPQPLFTTLADQFNGKRFNSPNDAAYHRSGDLYFTDPPYGLTEASNSELGFQGVFRLSTGGVVELLTDDLARPNGIAFSPDGSTLYVANSDHERAVWVAYDVGDDGMLSNARTFFDASRWSGSRSGLPDGLKVDDQGNLFATGPGGVVVLAPDSTHLGTIRLPVPAANVAFGDDGRYLYITADMYLLRIRLVWTDPTGTAQ
ncbi:MAG: SMP-30/gluconolactonase/LRE family protein [Rhodothermales bacterium]|nr:SMP-30/gluconolactonase/LRE family protein [Rhodothermales bacterium]